MLDFSQYLKTTDLHERPRPVTENDRARWCPDDRNFCMPEHLTSFTEVFEYLETEGDYDD